MIKAAIYGLGNWGQKLVDSVQGKSKKIRFEAGIVRIEKKYEEYARKVGIELTTDYEAVLADPEMGALILATPHSLHAEQVIQAAAAGKHVFVEKPFTLTKASAEEAIQACIDASVTLFVGHNRRYLPSLNDMKKIIAEGRIGKILHIESQHSGPSGYRPKPDSWRALRSENPAGGMAPRGIHSLDAMIYLNGLVQSVFAMSERLEIPLEMDDTTSMLCRFENGATGYLGTVIATANFWRIHVFGSKGWVEMQGSKALRVGDLNGAIDTKSYEDFDIQRAELEAFAEAVVGGQPFVESPEEIINGITVIEAMVESAQTGALVEIN
jgi:predicted dehydrogenase